MGVLKASSALLLATLCSWSVLVSAQYRLPGDTEPLDYTVTLKPTLEGGERPFSFEGSLDVKVIVRRITTTITMHAHKLEIVDVTVLDESNQPINGNPPTTTTDDKHFLVINLNRQAQVNETLNVHINYIGQMEDDMYGWYRSWYMEGNTKKWLASTQFQATHARRALPCYDEPAFKVPFKFTFIIPEGLGILFNTKSISRVPDVGNTEKVEFATTPAMSSYLLAFVLSNFQTLPGNENFAVWSRPSNVQQTAYAKSIMEPTVNAMIDFVNVPFVQGTINKLDTVAVPDFSSGAMENWGLVTYRERLIHWQDGVSSERNKQSLTSVVAHEIAHQWFGDLVSPAWWNNLWLSEGFATYFEFFACHEVEKTWRMDEQFVVYSVQDALRADGHLTSSAMNQEADSPSSISAKFDTISYEKGGSVIRMMELFLGTITFRMGLYLYLQTFSLRAATDDNLFAAMDAAFQLNQPTRQWLPNSVSVTQVMKTWVDKAGYPVITVERNYVNNTITFSQKRFLYSGNDTQSVWYVPLTMASQNEANFSTETKVWLMSQEPFEINNTGAADEWILVNINQGGFYRVNYDVENWRLLAQELETPNKLPAITRAQLVDDALNLARGGVLDYSVALNMTRFLKNETDFIPWASALTAFSFLDDRLQGSDTHSLFQKYVRLLLETVSKKLGYKETTDPLADPHVDRLHRNQIATWACNLGVQECLDAAKTQFQDYRSNDTLRVGPDMKSVVYCHGLLQGSEEDWKFLWDKYMDTQTATEQSAILVALGCSTNTEVLNSYLLKSIADTDEIRRQDALTVFSSTYSRPVGLNVALEFVKENVQNITAKYGGLNVVRNVVSGIASRLSTSKQIDEVEVVFEDANLNDPTLTEAVKSAIESARKNVEWTQRNRPAIHEWLENEVGASSVATLSVLLLAACFVWLAAL